MEGDVPEYKSKSYSHVFRIVLILFVFFIPKSKPLFICNCSQGTESFRDQASLRITTYAG